MNKSIISTLEYQATELDQKLTTLYQTDETIRDLYRGIFVWLSSVIENPEIMFLGINPGAGFYNNNNHTLAHSLKPLEVNEYVDPKQDYQLKWEWQYVFGDRGLNRMDLLEKSVKTNFCYLATENEKKLEKLFTQIRGKLDITPYEVFGNWTRQVVKEINPKLLICEGAKALEWMSRWSFKDEYKSELKNDDMEKGRIGNIQVLRFNRVFSTFKNIDVVIKEIKNCL